MIPMMNIIAWGNVVPWAEQRQVELDLIISRALVALFSDHDLRRQQIERREHHQQRDVEAPAEPGRSEGHHRSQQQHDRNRRNHDDDRVQEVFGQLRLVPGVDVVVEGELVGKRYVAVGRGVAAWPERGVDDPQHREQPQDRGRDQERVKARATPVERLANPGRHNRRSDLAGETGPTASAIWKFAASDTGAKSRTGS